MARLPEGERENRQKKVLRILQQHRWGLREVEIAEALEWNRRTVNNYLRDLEKEDRAHREGCCWFPG